jgi:hypothetical protein
MSETSFKQTKTLERDAAVRAIGRIKSMGRDPIRMEYGTEDETVPFTEPGVGGITAKFPGFSRYGNQPKRGTPVAMPNDGPANRWPTDRDYVARGHRQRDSEV